MSELHRNLRLLRNEADALTRQNWDRSIPFSDALFDRWERARDLGFGEGSSVFDSVHPSWLLASLLDPGALLGQTAQ